MSQEKQPWDIHDIAHTTGKFLETHIVKILVVFAVVIVGASAMIFKKNMDRKNEAAAFGELYAITKIYDEKKADFNTAKEEQEKAKQPPAKAGDKAEAPAPEKKKDLKTASGDITTDYGDVVSQLEAFVGKNSGKNASGEAALILSEIYTEYKQFEKGAESLVNALKDWQHKNILYYVMELRAGDLLASSNNCKDAVSHWQIVADSKSFVADQAQLKLGVCLQQIGRVDEAKNWFEKIKTDSPNSTEGFNAKRYLRYLDFKQKAPAAENKGEGKAQKEKSQETQS